MGGGQDGAHTHTHPQSDWDLNLPLCYNFMNSSTLRCPSLWALPPSVQVIITITNNQSPLTSTVRVL
jgi:hypothetical protein